MTRRKRDEDREEGFPHFKKVVQKVASLFNVKMDHIIAKGRFKDVHKIPEEL